MIFLSARQRYEELAARLAKAEAHISALYTWCDKTAETIDKLVRLMTEIRTAEEIATDMINDTLKPKLN